MSNEYACIRCGECCRNPFKLTTKLSDKGILDFLYYRENYPHGYWVLRDDMLYLYTITPCRYLKDNLCTKHNEKDRPDLCKNFYCKKYKINK